MGNGILRLFFIFILSAIFLLGIGIVAGQGTTQQVTVTVVPGFLEVYSPVNNQLYQTNNILLSFNITTGSLKVSDVVFIENKNSKYLCSKCKSYSEVTYFSNGKHDITIRAKFDNNEYVEQNISFTVDTGSDIYLYSGNVLKKASSKDIVEYLFNYNFSIKYLNELAPEDSCSVRARGGNATINGQDYGNLSKLNFYSITSITQGQIGLSAQKGRNFKDFKFSVNKTLENSEQLLQLELINKRTKETAILNYYKTQNKVDIISENYRFENLEVYFAEGCEIRMGTFYLLQKDKRTSNSIEQVRKLLSENPIFLQKFQNLNFLFSANWRVIRFLGLY